MSEFIPTGGDHGERFLSRLQVIIRLVRFRLGRVLLRRKVLIVVSALALSLYLGLRGVSYPELIVAFGALIVGVIVFNGEWGIRFGFVLWVLTLALGYRTIHWTSDLPIHPSEILLWVLLGSICVHRQLVSSTRLALPLWILLLLPFWVLAWWPLILGTAHWDQMLNEFRNFLLLIPLMVVATVVLKQRRNWRLLLLAFFAASTWIAVMGNLEYWFPGVRSLFPAFMSSPTPGMIEGFERATFSFWGGAMATFVCALALPIAIVAVRWWPARWQRTLIIIAAIAHVIAIYIGGYRSIWLLVVVEILLACSLSLKRQRLAVVVSCVVVTIGGYQFVPQAGHVRALSGIEALRGRATDSSAKDRIDRAQNALDRMFAAPIGSGWSAAGWVHSDFIQVGANLGVLAGLIFLGGYLFSLGRLFRRVVLAPRAGEQGDLGVALLLSYISAGGILATQGVEVLPQLVLPVWFVWVLVEVWLAQPVGEYEFAEASNILQLSNLGESPSLIAGAVGHE